MFLVLITYVKPMEEVDRWLPAHQEFLDRQYERGLFIVSGRRIPRVGGVILVNFTNEAEVRRILSEDPFQVHQVADYNFIEFDPTRYDPRFAAFLEGAG